MAADNAHGWKRALSAWLGRTGPQCVRVEVSIGARAVEVLGTFDCDQGHGGELADEIIAFVADVHSGSTNGTTYTLRARRADGDPITSVGIAVPAPRGEAPAAESSSLVSVLVKHVEQTHAMLVKLTHEQSTTFGSILATQRATLDSLSEENLGLRAQLREAQGIAGESLDELQRRDRELDSLRGTEVKWARVAQLVLKELDRKTGGAATKNLTGGVGSIVSAVAAELSKPSSATPPTNGAALEASTEKPEGKA